MPDNSARIANGKRIRKLAFGPKAIYKNGIIVFLTLVMPVLLTIYLWILQVRLEGYTDDKLEHLWDAIKALRWYNLLGLFYTLSLIAVIILTLFHPNEKRVTDHIQELITAMESTTLFLKAATNATTVRCNLFIFDKKNRVFGSLCAFNHEGNNKEYSEHALECFEAFHNLEPIIKDLSDEQKGLSSWSGLKSIYAAPVYRMPHENSAIGVVVIDSDQSTEKILSSGYAAREAIQLLAKSLSYILAS